MSLNEYSDKYATIGTADVILFKPTGKFYTEEKWLIPTVAVMERHDLFAGGRGDYVGPFVMRYSPDFRRISGGPVLVVTQEPWGYPHLLTVAADEAMAELRALQIPTGPPSLSVDLAQAASTAAGVLPGEDIHDVRLAIESVLRKHGVPGSLD